MTDVIRLVIIRSAGTGTHWTRAVTPARGDGGSAGGTENSTLLGDEYENGNGNGIENDKMQIQ